MILTAKIPRLDKPQPRRDGRGTVTCIKTVTLALLSLGKAAHPAVFAQALKPQAPARQQFVRIGLVPHIPHDLVLRQVQAQMQRHGQLHCPEIGSEMPSRDTDLVNQEISDLLRQQVPVFGCHVFYIIFFLYRF